MDRNNILTSYMYYSWQLVHLINIGYVVFVIIILKYHHSIIHKLYGPEQVSSIKLQISNNKSQINYKLQCPNYKNQFVWNFVRLPLARPEVPFASPTSPSGGDGSGMDLNIVICLSFRIYYLLLKRY